MLPPQVLGTVVLRQQRTMLQLAREASYVMHGCIGGRYTAAQKVTEARGQMQVGDGLVPISCTKYEAPGGRRSGRRAVGR